jgi:hypothetical protein
VHPISILTVDLKLLIRKKRKEEREGWTNRLMEGQTDGQTDKR